VRQSHARAQLVLAGQALLKSALVVVFAIAPLDWLYLRFGAGVALAAFLGELALLYAAFRLRRAVLGASLQSWAGKLRRGLFRTLYLSLEERRAVLWCYELDRELGRSDACRGEPAACLREAREALRSEGKRGPGDWWMRRILLLHPPSTLGTWTDAERAELHALCAAWGIREFYVIPAETRRDPGLAATLSRQLELLRYVARHPRAGA